MGTPVVGVRGGTYPEKGDWQVSFGWRNQYSDKHFVGSEYQLNRTNEGSEVINDINLADIGLRYQATRRIELSLGIPYFMGTRSQPARNTEREIVERYQTQSRDVGDVIFSARRWMLDPDSHPSSNIQLGVGVKLPTGPNNVTDTFRRFQPEDGSIASEIRTVDQSIQPGDGGFGILAELNAFKALAGGNVGVYLSGSYLANPGGTSGVRTYRSAPGEEVMSISDQYLVRAGTSVGIPGVRNLSLSVGMRWEGIPVRDLMGSSEGFRRPGYAVAVEPAINYVIGGKNVITLGIPFAVYRNRLVSVADEANGRHGDAAFADYLVLFGISHRF